VEKGLALLCSSRTTPSGYDGFVDHYFSLTSGTSMISYSMDLLRASLPVEKRLCFKWSQDKGSFNLNRDVFESNGLSTDPSEDELSACSLDSEEDE
jgi:hypothetical protein